MLSFVHSCCVWTVVLSQLPAPAARMRAARARARACVKCLKCVCVCVVGRAKRRSVYTVGVYFVHAIKPCFQFFKVVLYKILSLLTIFSVF